MTKDQIKKFIVPRLAGRRFADFRAANDVTQWATWQAAETDATNAQKKQLVDGLAARDGARVGVVLLKMLDAKFRTEAEEEADDMLTNDNLDLAELKRILT